MCYNHGNVLERNEDMKRLPCRILIGLLCVLMVCGSVSAGEVTLWMRFRPIERGVFATDSMYGVDAKYQMGGEYSCAELIARFYRTLYGVEIRVGDGVYVADSDTYWFEETTTPKAGDVVYAAPEKRGKGYAHYALVKYADAEHDVVTLMEQNWSYNGGAAYERTIAYKDDCHVFYTLRCKNGTPKMKLAEADTVSPWAEEAVSQADALGITDGLVAGYRRGITRGALARLCINVAEYAGLKVDQRNPYGAACALGIMECDADGEFAPWGGVTRAEAAVVLTRLLREIGGSTRSYKLPSLVDASEIPATARSSVAAALGTGLMQKEDGAFRPNDAVTTEQVITMLVRMVEMV